MSKHIGRLIVVSAIMVATPALGGIPNEIHHQGVIAVHGERFTGEGDFYFALVDELGYNLWTNDGTNIDPPSQQRPDSPVTLTVVNGVYRVRLGSTDTQEPPTTTPIPRAVFNENDHVALRIWFDDGVNGIHQLSPDQVLTGAPYAQRLPNVFVEESTGHVGIGTTAPEANLHIREDDNPAVLKLEGTGGARGPWEIESREVESMVDGVTEWRSALGIGPPGANKVVIRDDGNVGIGTSKPKQRLHNTGDYYGKGHMYLHAAQGDGTSGTAYIQARDDSGTSSIDMRLRTQNEGDWTNVMLLTEDGKVNIGPGAPVNELSVEGNANFTGKVGIGTTAPTTVPSLLVNGGVRARGGEPGAGGEQNRGYAFHGEGDNDSGMFSQGNFLQFFTNSHEQMRITGAGDVGIGTTNPQAELDVNGSIRLFNSGTYQWDGAEEAEAFRLTSGSGPECNGEHNRGSIFVARISGQNRDALCVCMNDGGAYKNWCFMP